MKHTFTLAFFAIAISTLGQTEKGNSLISGTISTTYSVCLPPKDAPTKRNYVGTSTGVSYGKFVKDNIAWRTDFYQTFSRNFEEENYNGQTTRQILSPRTFISLSSLGLYYLGKDRWRGFTGAGIQVNGNFSNQRTMNSGGTIASDYTQKAQILL